MLKIENLSFAYNGETKNTLSDISLSVKRGEIVVVCGKTGSGKTTLLRLLKREISPRGKRQGRILFENRDISEMSDRESATEIAFVTQHPEQQIVTDKVWHELAFGLENLGADQKSMQRRVAEIAQYFGIEDLFDKRTSELSGGQKQLLALASAMITDPKILILDEPTSQLDPISASNFISTVCKISRELSVTVIMTEHRLEEIIPVADKILLLEDGKVMGFGKSENVVRGLAQNSDYHDYMPSAARLYYRLGEINSVCPPPLDVRGGRKMIESFCENRVRSVDTEKNKNEKSGSESVIKAKDLYFRYKRELPDVLCEFDITLKKGELYAILGSNGSGKSTALGALSGIRRPYSGTVEIFGKRIEKYTDASLYNGCLAMLPQDVQTLFMKDSVRDELLSYRADTENAPVELKVLFDKHPYDLSGGQQQMLALYILLSAKPKILLLDEPTKGLDAKAKIKLGNMLSTLCENGLSVLIVTHDVEFAARFAHKCALFFKGRIVSEDETHKFFTENAFYTTQIRRMTKGYFENAVSVEDAEWLCLSNKRKDGREE